MLILTNKTFLHSEQQKTIIVVKMLGYLTNTSLINYTIISFPLPKTMPMCNDIFQSIYLTFKNEILNARRKHLFTSNFSLGKYMKMESWIW